MSIDEKAKSDHIGCWATTVLLSALIGAAAMIGASFIAKWNFSPSGPPSDGYVQQLQKEVSSLRSQLHEKDAQIQALTEKAALAARPQPKSTVAPVPIQSIRGKVPSTQQEASPTPEPRTESVPSLPHMSVEVEDFSFTVLQCLRAGSRVTCDFTVENVARSARRLVILSQIYDPVDPFNTQGINGTYSFAVDNLGIRHAPAGVKEYESSSLLSDVLHPGILVRFRVIYDAIQPEVKKLNVILDCRNEQQKFQAVLRDLSIER